MNVLAVYTLYPVDVCVSSSGHKGTVRGCDASLVENLHMDVSGAMAAAAARRVPLVILVVPSDESARTALQQRIGLPQLASLAIWHVVTQGTTEFAQLTDATGLSSAPRAHIFPPAARGLGPTLFDGEELTYPFVRQLLVRAAEWTQEEYLEARRAEASAAAALLAASRQIAMQPTVSSKMDRPEPDVQQRAENGLRVVVVAGEEIDADLGTIAALRSSSVLAYARREIAGRLGHSNFVFHRNGTPLSAVDEERRVIADVGPVPADGRTASLSVHLTRAALAMRAARLQTSPSQSATKEPDTQRGPTGECPTKSHASVKLVLGLPGQASITLDGDPSSALSTYWPLLAEKCPGASAIRVAVSGPGDLEDIIDIERAERITLAELLRCNKAAVIPVDQPGQCTAAPASVDGQINVRLILPRGGDVVVPLKPTETLWALYRAAADALQGDNTTFFLQQAYPPRRFDDADYDTPLHALGIVGNVAIRVMLAGSPQPHTDAAPAVGSLTSIVSRAALSSARVVGGLFRRGSPPTGDEATPSVPLQRIPPSRAPVTSMAELRSRETADERHGSNTYFGGDSTEYQAQKPKDP